MRPLGADGGGAAAAPLLVGRARERALLGEQVARLHAGHGGLVVVCGEAGIGKTRLVEAFADDCRDSECLVRWSRCRTGEGAPAYLAWIHLLRGWAADHAAAGADGARGLVALFDAASEERAPRAAPARLAGADRFRLFDAIADGLTRAALQRPLVLVFDDLQEADVGSLRLLEFVAGSLDQTRVLVLGTLREPPPPPPPLSHLLGSPSTVRLSLGGLTRPDVARLIEALRPQRPDADLVEQLCARTGGNPFFVAECVRLLDAGGATSIPQAVGDVLRQRAAVLRESTRWAVSFAAVIRSEEHTSELQSLRHLVC